MTSTDERDRETSDDAVTGLASPTASSSRADKDMVPTLRLCQLIRWRSYGGYGFDVVTSSRRPPCSRDNASPTVTDSYSRSNRRYGHFVGKVFFSRSVCANNTRLTHRRRCGFEVGGTKSGAKRRNNF